MLCPRVTKPSCGGELVFAMEMRNLEDLCEEKLLSLLFTRVDSLLLSSFFFPKSPSHLSFWMSSLPLTPCCAAAALGFKGFGWKWSQVTSFSQKKKGVCAQWCRCGTWRCQAGIPNSGIGLKQGLGPGLSCWTHPGFLQELQGIPGMPSRRDAQCLPRLCQWEQHNKFL